MTKEDELVISIVMGEPVILIVIIQVDNKNSEILSAT